MLLPLRDDNPLNNIRLAYVTLVIIVACVLVFTFQLTLSGEEEQIFVFGFGAIPAVVFGLTELPATIAQVPAALTLVTSMFLHGGFMHLLGNMLFLWVLGDNVEDAMGHKRFLIFYLLAGVIAALAHAITEPGSQVPMVGASGAISGVIGAYLMLHPKARIKTLVGYFILSLPAWVVLGFWIGLQVLSAATDTGGAGGGVAWWAHIGGFMAGVILIIPMRRKGVQLFDRGKKSFELKLGLSKTKRRKSRIPDSGGPGDGRKKSGPWG
ncbi:MAG: rhomboid family intramembrane serine protease [Proteobacteria bacterium]|nr:rhomboid family intramembrane serine protease [Pseudomonadota bacterium]MDA1023456.1 rhomboid family intramembrane serine protease [Pseudomonadota bacterium]